LVQRDRRRGQTIKLDSQSTGPGIETSSVLVFDSGLGGLTVLREIARVRPEAALTFVADDAAFPYGRLGDQALIDRVVAVMDRYIAELHPALVVIACNTASTLALPVLRARFPIPFVGTVPAIKPARAQSKSKRISVLATAGTVRRDYTRDLIEKFAGDCRVTLTGADRLAGNAEAALRGEAVDDDEISREIAPCFVDDAGRTDTIVLACTHYPLILDRLERLAPWPVTWIDPAPAIAQRTSQLLGPERVQSTRPPIAFFTSGSKASPALVTALASFGVEIAGSSPVKLPV
jgi:glutamate racemase